MELSEMIHYYYHEMADPRIRDLFLYESIWTPTIILLVYVIVIFKLAPHYMKDRPAYKLNTFIKCYNIFQVMTNAYLVKEFSSCYSFLRAFDCGAINYNMDPCSRRVVNASSFTALLKVIDLIETLVFVLRKKDNQITILHLYHHISTVLITIGFTKFFSVEVALLFPILNCSVHVIMYSYYFLSNFEGSIKKMITPFKPYLTIIQMVQFVILIIKLLNILQDSCALPKYPICIMLLNMFFNLALFYNFYRKAYPASKNKKL